jgi:hypothetical protein
MDFKELAGELKAVFDAKGYTWNIDGALTIPSELDILDTMTEMARQLESVPSGTWMELGRLIFIKTGEHLDVYVLHATINQSKDTNE